MYGVICQSNKVMDISLISKWLIGLAGSSPMVLVSISFHIYIYMYGVICQSNKVMDISLISKWLIGLAGSSPMVLVSISFHSNS